MKKEHANKQLLLTVSQMQQFQSIFNNESKGGSDPKQKNPNDNKILNDYQTQEWVKAQRLVKVKQQQMSSVQQVQTNASRVEFNGPQQPPVAI